jgi:hypothetical protein
MALSLGPARRCSDGAWRCQMLSESESYPLWDRWATD